MDAITVVMVLITLFIVIISVIVSIWKKKLTKYLSDAVGITKHFGKNGIGISEIHAFDRGAPFIYYCVHKADVSFKDIPANGDYSDWYLIEFFRSDDSFDVKRGERRYKRFLTFFPYTNIPFEVVECSDCPIKYTFVDEVSEKNYHPEVTLTRLY